MLKVREGCDLVGNFNFNLNGLRQRRNLIYIKRGALRRTCSFNIKRATLWRNFGDKIRRVLLGWISVHNIKRDVFVVNVIKIDWGQIFDINNRITALQQNIHFGITRILLRFSTILTL